MDRNRMAIGLSILSILVIADRSRGFALSPADKSAIHFRDDDQELRGFSARPEVEEQQREIGSSRGNFGVIRRQEVRIIGVEEDSRSHPGLRGGQGKPRTIISTPNKNYNNQSPEYSSSRKQLQEVPLKPEVRPPQVQIHIVKQQFIPSDRILVVNTEYKYSNKEYNTDKVEMESEKEEIANEKTNENGTPENSEGNYGSLPPGVLPAIGSRNIITGAEIECPKGQKKDANGQCRPEA